MPKISVIIPAYNAMRFLPETLNSVFSQSLDDFEVIIVNDGSSDGIEDWFLTVTDQRVCLVSQQNQGLAASRNTGLAHATGEYIAFLDADDLWHPTKLAKQAQKLDDNPEVGLVYTWLAVVGPDNAFLGKVVSNQASGHIWRTLLDENVVGCGSVPMIRRSCLDRVGGFDTSLPASYGEDWDMWLRLAPHFQFDVVKEVLVYYRSHPNNLSKTWQAMEKSHQIIIEKVFASAPSGLLHLKQRTYANAYINIAWKAFQNLGGDCKTVQHYQRKAIACYPEMRYSKRNLRLSTAIFFMRFFGPHGYARVLELVNSTRRLAAQATQKLKVSLS